MASSSLFGRLNVYPATIFVHLSGALHTSITMRRIAPRPRSPSSSHSFIWGLLSLRRGAEREKRFHLLVCVLEKIRRNRIVFTRVNVPRDFGRRKCAPHLPPNSIHHYARWARPYSIITSFLRAWSASGGRRLPIKDSMCRVF